MSVVPNSITGFNNGIDLVTHGDYQFAVWWTIAGELRIGRIERGVQIWGVDHDEYEFAGSPRTALACPVEADEHNYCAVGVDGLGRIHVQANMHMDTMRAVKSVDPHTSDTWLATAGWASATSDFPSIGSSCTYPMPLPLSDGTLWFLCRDVGVAGRGDTHFWTRGPAATTWSAATFIFQGIDVPGVTDSGLNDRTNWSAYPILPYIEAPGEANPGRMHMFWTWRTDTIADDVLPGYTYSDDQGTSWKAIDGTGLTLPITILNNHVTRIPGSAYFTTLARSGNVVTAEADSAAHGYSVSDVIGVWAVDDTFTGSFTITSVGTPNVTSVRWSQTAADDASGGPAVSTRTLWSNGGATAVGEDGLPNCVLTGSGSRIWVRHNGTAWTQSNVTNPLAGQTIHSRPGGMFWHRGAFWFLANGAPSTTRRPRLWRLDGQAQVCMGGNTGPSDWEPCPDPEAWRRFGVIETLTPDGNKPRVTTLGNHARATAA